jgi:hypothetical protein
VELGNGPTLFSTYCPTNHIEIVKETAKTFHKRTLWTGTEFDLNIKGSIMTLKRELAACARWHNAQRVLKPIPVFRSYYLENYTPHEGTADIYFALLNA